MVAASPVRHAALLFRNRDALPKLTRLLSASPGIFFKYDIEPVSLTIRERTTTLVQFLIRLAGIVGGILGAPSNVRRCHAYRHAR
jgi:hypothetical protein